MEKMNPVELIKKGAKGELTTERDAILREQKAEERGRMNTYRKMIDILFDETNGHSTIYELLHAMEAKRLSNTLKGSLEERILGNILDTTRTRLIGWNPETGFDVVSYEPNEHITYDKLSPGEKALVVEVGCAFRNGDIERSPIVRRTQS